MVVYDDDLEGDAVLTLRHKGAQAALPDRLARISGAGINDAETGRIHRVRFLPRTYFGRLGGMLIGFPIHGPIQPALTRNNSILTIGRGQAGSPLPLVVCVG